MEILVTGASGFLGFRLIERLIREPGVSRIIASGRLLKPGMVVQSKKVMYEIGDLTEPEVLESLFERNNIHQVIHCAALSSPWGSYDDFYKANVLITKSLLKNSKSDIFDRIIYISTPSIYFNFRNRLGVKESDPISKRWVNFYAKTKYESEQLVRESGLRFVILRPRAIIGRGDIVIMPRLIAAAKAGRLRVIGRGKNIIDVTSVENIVEAIVLAIKADEEVCNDDYNISNGEPIRFWEMLGSILEDLGIEWQRKKIPFWLMYTLAFILEKYHALFRKGQEPVITRYSAGTIAKSFTFDITKARQKLGYHPSYPIGDALKDFTKWYKQRDDKGKT